MKIDKSKWEYKKLGEVCYPKAVIKRAKSLIHDEEEISYIDISSIDNAINKITGTTEFILAQAPSRAQQVVEYNDVLYSLVRPNLKKIAKVDLRQKNLVASSGFCVLRSSIIDSQFLFHLLLSNHFTSYILQHIAGANYPATRECDVMNYKFALPPKDVQQQIVSELDKLNALISMKQQQLKEFDTLAQAIFYQMFGDNDPQSQLNDYCKIKGGKRIPKGMTLSPMTTNHPYLRVTDMKDGTISDADIKYIDDTVYNVIKRYTISQENVYLTNVGANLGMAGTVPEKFDQSNLTENAVKLVFDNEVLNKTFLAWYLNSPSVQKQIDKRKMHVGVPKLAIFRIESLPLFVPPLPLQQSFAHKIESIEHQKTLVKSCIADLQLLLDSKMDEYFG